MSDYSPELGQMLFGQPSQQFGASNLLISALDLIDYELTRVQENITQQRWDSPFSNTGNQFKNNVFEVEAYSWNDEVEQPYNFKCKEIEVSWYKHSHRGVSVNKLITSDEISEMLDACLKSIQEME